MDRAVGPLPARCGRDPHRAGSRHFLHRYKRQKPADDPSHKIQSFLCAKSCDALLTSEQGNRDARGACGFPGSCYPFPVMKPLMRILPLRILVVLLVVALSTSGFAHRFMTPDDQAALDYAQSFGLDVTDICGGVDGKGAQQQTCGACLLHASMSLPAPAISVIVAELSLAPADWVPQPPVRHALTSEATRPARAPPTV